MPPDEYGLQELTRQTGVLYQAALRYSSLAEQVEMLAARAERLLHSVALDYLLNPSDDVNPPRDGGVAPEQLAAAFSAAALAATELESAVVDIAELEPDPTRRKELYAAVITANPDCSAAARALRDLDSEQARQSAGAVAQLFGPCYAPHATVGEFSEAVRDSLARVTAQIPPINEAPAYAEVVNKWLPMLERFDNNPSLIEHIKQRIREIQKEAESLARST